MLILVVRKDQDDIGATLNVLGFIGNEGQYGIAEGHRDHDEGSDSVK